MLSPGFYPQQHRMACSEAYVIMELGIITRLAQTPNPDNVTCEQERGATQELLGMTGRVTQSHHFAKQLGTF